MTGYHALYQDDRDPDESAVAECATIDDCSDAIVLYFKRYPNHYAHCEHWRIIRASDGLEMAFGHDMILS